MIIDEANTTTYKTILTKSVDFDQIMHPNIYTQQDMDLNDDISIECPSDTFIPLTSSDKSRFYLPWKNSVIVKVFGRRVGHQVLKQKLISGILRKSCLL